MNKQECKLCKKMRKCNDNGYCYGCIDEAGAMLLEGAAMLLLMFFQSAAKVKEHK